MWRTGSQCYLGGPGLDSDTLQDMAAVPKMPETPFLQVPHMYTFEPVIASFGNSSEKRVTEAREPSTAQGQVGNELEDPYAVGWCLPLLGGFLWSSLEPWTCASLEGPESAATHTRVTLDLGPGQAFSPW